jgi:hypothetical protein
VKTIKDFEYSFNHVKQRLLERYNIKIDIDEYIVMNSVIKIYREDIKHFKPIAVDNNGDQEVWIYKGLKEVIQVVFSVSKRRITTVLNTLPEREYIKQKKHRVR